MTEAIEQLIEESDDGERRLTARVESLSLKQELKGVRMTEAIISSVSFFVCTVGFILFTRNRRSEIIERLTAIEVTLKDHIDFCKTLEARQQVDCKEQAEECELKRDYIRAWVQRVEGRVDSFTNGGRSL